jgi:transposase InsO family protein
MVDADDHRAELGHRCDLCGHQKPTVYGRVPFHSDRASQYASEHFRELLKKHGLGASMSPEAECCDDAVVESFF